jgi:DNA-binding HxlR family transcriptional regulator
VPLHTAYHDPECSVASALDLVGSRWTLLVVRELLLGVHRFDEIQADLGIARTVLQARLQALIAAGIVERRRYHEHPPRFAYHLTERGLELWPAVVSLMRWGDRHALAPGGRPAVVLAHRDCGGEIDDHLLCERCGARLGPRDVWARPGEGAGPDHPLRRRRPGT